VSRGKYLSAVIWKDIGWGLKPVDVWRKQIPSTAGYCHLLLLLLHSLTPLSRLIVPCLRLLRFLPLLFCILPPSSPTLVTFSSPAFLSLHFSFLLSFHLILSLLFYYVSSYLSSHSPFLFSFVSLWFLLRLLHFLVQFILLPQES
jgi:hypothetical protein